MKVEQEIQEINEKLDAIIKYLGISAKPQRNVVELRREANKIMEKIQAKRVKSENVSAKKA